MEKIFGIGVYNKRDYQELLKVSDDREDMDPTWEIWRESKSKAIRDFRLAGTNPVEIPISAKELITYCRENGLPLNGESRSRFIAYKTQELYKK